MSPKRAHGSISLLHDCQQLIREFLPLLKVASSQMYISVPAFIPGASPLLKIYHQEFKNSVKILHHENRSQHWDTCLRTIGGHIAPVNAAAFSPNGSCIVSASYHTIQLWDTASGAQIKTYQGHTKAVLCVIFSHDGAYIWSGSADCTLCMWNTFTGEVLNVVECINMVCSVSCSPNGNHVVFGGKDDGVVKLWNKDDLTILPNKKMEHYHKLRGHKGVVLAVCFSPDSIHFITGASDRLVLLWDVKTHNVLHKFKGHADAVISLAVSHTGTQFASGSLDNTICLWHMETRSQLRKLEGHLACVNGVSFSPDDAYIVSASDDKTIQHGI